VIIQQAFYHLSCALERAVLGGNVLKCTSDKGLYLVQILNLTKQLKNGQKATVDNSPQKIHRKQIYERMVSISY
jgi:hypothetical protein